MRSHAHLSRSIKTYATRAEASFYDTLGLSPSATTGELRDSYVRLVKQCHPDRGGDAQCFIQVQAAYAALRRPISRSGCGGHRAEAQASASPPHDGESRAVWALGCSLLVGASGMASAAYWAREKQGTAANAGVQWPMA